MDTNDIDTDVVQQEHSILWNFLKELVLFYNFFLLLLFSDYFLFGTLEKIM